MLHNSLSPACCHAHALPYSFALDHNLHEPLTFLIALLPVRVLGCQGARVLGCYGARDKGRGTGTALLIAFLTKLPLPVNLGLGRLGPQLELLQSQGGPVAGGCTSEAGSTQGTCATDRHTTQGTPPRLPSSRDCILCKITWQPSHCPCPRHHLGRF